MDRYGVYTENFAVNWLETNYIVTFAENYIAELTAWNVVDWPRNLFGRRLVTWSNVTCQAPTGWWSEYPSHPRTRMPMESYYELAKI
jgi:hypothetical protein